MHQKRGWLRCLRRLGADAAMAGVCLCIFALFHHVLPRASTEAPLAVIPVTTEASPTQTAEPVTLAAQATAAPTEAPATAAETSARGKQGRGGSGGKGGASSGKGGSALTDDSADTEAAATASLTESSESYAALFSQETISTADCYRDSGLSVTVTQQETAGAVYYVADIYLADVTRLQTALAGDTYGTGYRDSILDMATLAGAVLAVNGDYYGNTSEGVVIRNGVVYRANATSCDVCVLYQDGTLRTMAGSAFDVEEAIADGAWQAWTFGPALLSGSGEAITSFASTSHILSANPRTAIGYYAPGHYCLMVVDGRGQNGSEGMTLSEMSSLFASMGCTAAYNLDGGNSSVMVWQDAVINAPSGGGRESSDCIILTT